MFRGTYISFSIKGTGLCFGYQKNSMGILGLRMLLTRTKVGRPVNTPVSSHGPWLPIQEDYLNSKTTWKKLAGY
jgi:hypothetical protein